MSFPWRGEEPLPWTAMRHPRWFRYATAPIVFLRMYKINRSPYWNTWRDAARTARYFTRVLWLEPRSERKWQA